jgi:hypothetical protein
LIVTRRLKNDRIVTIERWSSVVAQCRGAQYSVAKSSSNNIVDRRHNTIAADGNALAPPLDAYCTSIEASLVVASLVDQSSRGSSSGRCSRRASVVNIAVAIAVLITDAHRTTCSHSSSCRIVAARVPFGAQIRVCQRRRAPGAERLARRQPPRQAEEAQITLFFVFEFQFFYVFYFVQTTIHIYVVN